MRYGKLIDGNLQYAEIKHGALVVDGKLVFTTDYAAYGYYPVEYVYEDGTDELVDGVIKHYMGKQKPYIPTIEELTEQKLRERYSINQEFEVQRKRDTDPQGFAAYYDYVEECIAWAKSQPHKD